jgi:5-hydroxyisourate hydrolase-like protein (transthyretin family)
MAAMQLGRVVIGGTLGLLLAFGLGTVPVQAADELTPTTLTLTAAAAHADESTPLAMDLVQSADGAPVAAAQVLVERRRDGTWQALGVVTTDDVGHAELAATLRRTAGDNVFRASYAGDALHAGSLTGSVPVALVRRTSRLSVDGPESVIDEQSVEIRVLWTTTGGEPVAGRVRLFRATGGGDWKLVSRLTTGEDGRAALEVRPRVDTRWRAQAAALDWVEAARSTVHGVDNLPPGRPVRLPDGAPRPRLHLPSQAHAVGVGPHVTITRIPAGVWRQMTGVTWRQGCPVGRSQLRYARINYWDYTGYRRRGELVANADAVGRITAALAEMYTHGLPLRSMYRPDRFGYSSRVRGGDDFASMAAGNTSVFNCRDVVNKPGVRSPHAWGRAFDVNTWENPYRSAQGTVPNTWWQSRSHPLVAWRSSSHEVVEIMARHGLRWTYGLGDTQHFDAVAGNGRFTRLPADCDGVCE